MNTHATLHTETNNSQRLLLGVQKILEQRGTPIPGWNAPRDAISRFRAAVAEALVELEHPASLIPRTAEDLTGMMAGLGMLQQVIEEPHVEEVMVRNGYLLVERKGRIASYGQVADDEYFLSLARRAADIGGRAMWGDRPFVLVDLPGGHRLTAMIPPLSIEGTAINVRVHRRKAFTLGDLSGLGAFAGHNGHGNGRDMDTVATLLKSEGVDVPTPPLVAFLARAVYEGAASIIISGEFSSGKTTLLGALLRVVPEHHVLAVVETFRELKISHPYPARAVVPDILEKNGGLPPMREVVNVLYTRMRPDVIVFGEVVGDEAVPLLDAMNLGKRVLTTIHCDSAYGALLRLEMLALGSGLPLPAIQERVAAGIDLVIHMARRGNHRYVSEVVMVNGHDPVSKTYDLATLYSADDGLKDQVAHLRSLWRENA